jgi:hypothetical protein
MKVANTKYQRSRVGLQAGKKYCDYTTIQNGALKLKFLTFPHAAIACFGVRRFAVKPIRIAKLEDIDEP